MYQPRPILKKYYDSLEEQKVLGMECQECKEVVWPPLPTCQSCGSFDMEWKELLGEAIVEEFSFTGETPGLSGSFHRGNPFFKSDESYCLCTGRLKEGTTFNAALFGVSAENVVKLTNKLPFAAKVEFIDLEGGFKAVGFRVSEETQ